MLALLPLGGVGSRNSLALVWSVDQLRAPTLLAQDAPAILQPRCARRSHGALGGFTLASERAAWPLQRAMADRWRPFANGAAWVLAGDAAHTVHPLAGQGLNLGLADARSLAARAAGRANTGAAWATQRLLRRYERARTADVLAMSLATDGLQQLFAHGADPLPALRNWGMRGFDRTRAAQALGRAAGHGPALSVTERTRNHDSHAVRLCLAALAGLACAASAPAGEAEIRKNLAERMPQLAQDRRGAQVADARPVRGARQRHRHLLHRRARQLPDPGQPDRREGAPQPDRGAHRQAAARSTSTSCR